MVQKIPCRNVMFAKMPELRTLHQKLTQKLHTNYARTWTKSVIKKERKIFVFVEYKKNVGCWPSCAKAGAGRSKRHPGPKLKAQKDTLCQSRKLKKGTPSSGTFPSMGVHPWPHGVYFVFLIANMWCWEEYLAGALYQTYSTWKSYCRQMCIIAHHHCF